MKVLSVQQPWASLIVAGIKDVENRTWQPKENPGRILIHASKKTSLRAMGNEPLEWVQEIFNEQTYGNLPDFNELPDGAIIGYVTVDKIDHDTNQSVWASGPDNVPDLFYWHLKDAYIFDEPISGVKGKLHLWEYNIDEDNLPPAHQAKVIIPSVTDESITVPVKRELWDNLAANQTLALELGTLANDICLPDVFNLKPLKTITFTHNGEKRSFALQPETEAQYYTDGSEEQNPAKYLSLFEKEGATRWVAYFVWGKEFY